MYLNATTAYFYIIINSFHDRTPRDEDRCGIGICTQISEGGQVIYHDPVVWVADPGFIFQRDKTLTLGVFEEDCIFRSWAIEALEKVGIKYRIVYVSRSISGILDAVRAGIAIAPVVLTNVPADLKIVGIEEGLPALPVSNIVLHKVKRPLSDTVECFANHIIKTFREKI